MIYISVTIVVGMKHCARYALLVLHKVCIFAGTVTLKSSLVNFTLNVRLIHISTLCVTQQQRKALMVKDQQIQQLQDVLATKEEQIEVILLIDIANI